ncbi:MAG TPA: hypothetical protein DCS67_03915 [Clostridiales bacterium UBA8960]|jgi:hypothetical protein|nr:hypothetical protein [Clostridiales bacterium UBA8960]
MKRQMIRNTCLVIAIGILGYASWLKLNKETSSLLYQAHAAVKAEYGDFYIPSKEIDTEVLKNVYGIQMDDVEDYIAESAMMRTHVDVFIGIKAKKGKSDGIVNVLETHRQRLSDEYRGDSAKFAKIQASKVTKFGDYVFFMVLGQNSDAVVSDVSYFLATAQTEFRRGELVLGNIFK